MNHRATEPASAVIGHPAVPMRVQLSREKGWRLPPNTIKVDRSTEFGNPYCVGERVNMTMVRRWGWEISRRGQKIVCEDAREAVDRFMHALHWDEAIHPHLREKLGGKNLACWCALDKPCHADALITIGNSTPQQISAFHEAIDQTILKRAADSARQ